MAVKITSEKKNPLLKRKEVSFQVLHQEQGATPSRKEIRKSVAITLKTDENLVFIKKFQTRTGTRVAHGVAHIYESLEHAKSTEPKYIINRNIPPEKPEKEKKA